jgi:kynureninase
MPVLDPHDDNAWAATRARFHLPPGQIYLDGNSLGLLCQPAQDALLRVVVEWATRGIGGWLEGEPPWVGLAEDLARDLSPLLGVEPTDLILTGQTTPNLHQLLATLYTPGHPTRRVILADELNFASDRYALVSHLRLRGLDPVSHLRLVRSRDGFTLATADVVAALADDVQVAVLPSVLFTSGQLLDLTAIAAAARARGILLLWDLSHSLGAVPHALAAEGADGAFWCTYKYLNGGPGAPGGLWLHPQHAARPPGLAGWWGVRPDRRFAFAPAHEPAPGAARLHIGTPSILGLAPLQGALRLFAEVGGIAAVRARSLALTDHLIRQAETLLTPLGVSIVTPRDSGSRGGHVALAHPEAARLAQAWRAVGVVPDFRPPAVLRVAPVAFYNTFADLDTALARLADILRTGAHRAYPAPTDRVP